MKWIPPCSFFSPKLRECRKKSSDKNLTRHDIDLFEMSSIAQSKINSIAQSKINESINLWWIDLLEIRNIVNCSIKNQLICASCGLDQSIDRYSRWGPPACSNVLAGWGRVWSCRLAAPQPPCPPAPSTGSLPSFLCRLFGGAGVPPEPYFFAHWICTQSTEKERAHP